MPGSKEDVIPRWMRREFERAGLSGPLTVSVGRTDQGVETRAIHQRHHLRLTLKDVICEPCKNFFGRELEWPVSKFLGPMVVYAAETVLSTDERRLLARWATLKALLIELAWRQNYPGRRPVEGYTPSEPELAWLRHESQPLPRARVWLGAFDAQDHTTKRGVTQRTDACLIRIHESLGTHITTLTFGYVALMVFTIDFLRADAFRLPEFDYMPADVARFFEPLWPGQVPHLSWPGVAYNDAMSEYLTSWPSRVPRSNAA